MKAHDVRNLRYCEVCKHLGHKADFLTSGAMCVPCAYVAAGSVDDFMLAYPQADWMRLPIGLVGAEGMRALLDAISAARGEA